MAGTITRRRFNFDDEPEAGQPSAIPASDPMAERFIREYERVKREQFEIEEVAFSVRMGSRELVAYAGDIESVMTSQLLLGLYDGLRAFTTISVNRNPATNEVEYRASLLLARKK